MTYIYFLLLFCSFFPYICITCLPSCMVNTYYYIQRWGVTLKSNRSRSLKMGPIDRSYSRACVTITSSGVCFVSKQLVSTSFRRQVLSTLLVQRWRGSSGNVRLSNLLISSCWWLWSTLCRRICYCSGSNADSLPRKTVIIQRHTSLCLLATAASEVCVQDVCWAPAAAVAVIRSRPVCVCSPSAVHHRIV